MTIVSNTSEMFPAPGATSSKANSMTDMGADDFLTLMVAQLQHQDPTKPMDNTEFVAQLAQFSTSTGVQELNESFSGLSASLTSSQMLQATDLVGRQVSTESNVGFLEAATDQDGEAVGVLDATVSLGGNRGGMLYVQDMTGQLVYSAALPADATGDFQIRWGGTDASGNMMPPGSYRISAEANVGGEMASVPVYAHSRVQSVSINPATGTASLNLVDGSKLSFAEIRNIF
ncbi:MAG: flagellar biosynthesis protein FlgD [Luminiphilus sp.]|jgi:flagellar basal-body rod modification protein FlgD|nr:flagellar biosynthesis protein FlgD [Luminiphilus sp.]